MSHKNYAKYSQAKQEKNNEVVLDKTSIDTPEVNGELPTQEELKELGIELVSEEEINNRINEIQEHLKNDMDDDTRLAYQAELDQLLGVTDKTENQTDEIIQDTLKEETRTGIVSGCIKLRVRKEANAESDVYGTIEKGTELTVSITHSTEEFYKVNTIINDELVSGYCMKKFITLK